MAGAEGPADGNATAGPEAAAAADGMASDSE
jgi:hypothetical protein